MIKKTIKNISNIGASVYSMEALIGKTNQRLILPFYHIVTDSNPIHIEHLYEPRRIAQFKADLDFLLENYKSISLNELIELNDSGNEPTENYFHLTFDDGLKEFYTIVAPLLKERGVHATVFLNSDFIDNRELFFRFKSSILFHTLKDEELLNVKYGDSEKLDQLAKKNGVDFNQYLETNSPYLTSEQIKQLIGEGFTFGAHSKTHPLYKELSLKEQLAQTKESIEAVKSQFDLDYSVFSFPFTDDGVSLALFNKIEHFTDLTFGCAGIKEDTVKSNLQRIPMETNQTGKDIVKAEYLYCLMKQKAGKNKITRQ